MVREIEEKPGKRGTPKVKDKQCFKKRVISSVKYCGEVNENNIYIDYMCLMDGIAKVSFVGIFGERT